MKPAPQKAKPVPGQQCFKCEDPATVTITNGAGEVTFACLKHARKRKSAPRPKGWRPTREQKARILDSGLRNIVCDKDPDLIKGQIVELCWARPAKIPRLEDGTLPELPRLPTAWIVVRSVKHEGDEWVINFHLTDQRASKRLLRSKPPVFDAEVMREDAKRKYEGKGLSAEQIEEARLEGAYTTDPSAASDPLDAPDDDALAEFTIIAAAKAHKREQSESLEQRLQIVRSEAKAQGVDISRIDASIERRIKAAERRLRAKGKAA